MIQDHVRYLEQIFWTGWTTHYGRSVQTIGVLGHLTLALTLRGMAMKTWQQNGVCWKRLMVILCRLGSFYKYMLGWMDAHEACACMCLGHPTTAYL
jgi:hypothetical protein